MSAPDGTVDFVKEVFSEVPETYDRVNHILTLGFDTIWRKRAAKSAAKAKSGRWVDICTGTGEMAVFLSRLAPAGTQIHAVDFSPAMMAEAQKKPEASNIDFITADMKALPFADNSVDLLTMSFATRNINIGEDGLLKGFSELHRVLKPGGHFINIETSQPSSSLIRKCFHIYIGLLVRQLGSRISGSHTAYSYLSQTIPRFYAADQLADIMRQAGFETVTYKRLMFGVAAIHKAIKGT